MDTLNTSRNQLLAKTISEELFTSGPYLVNLLNLRQHLLFRMQIYGCGSKLNHQGTADFCPCFLLPGQPILGLPYF